MFIRTGGFIRSVVLEIRLKGFRAERIAIHRYAWWYGLSQNRIIYQKQNVSDGYEFLETVIIIVY